MGNDEKVDFLECPREAFDMDTVPRPIEDQTTDEETFETKEDIEESYQERKDKRKKRLKKRQI